MGGGGSDKEAVKKQFEIDKKQYDFQNQKNLDKYKEAVAIQDLDKANAENAREIKNQTALDNWRYQQDLKKKEYKGEARSYRQGLKDYDKQVEYNSKGAAISYEAERRKLEEAIISAGFDKNDAKLQMAQDRSDAAFSKADLVRQRRTAVALNRNEQAQLNVQNRFDMEQAGADIGYTKEKTGDDIRYTRQSARADLDLNRDKYLDDSKRLQAENFYARLETMSEKFRQQGAARATGVEGMSARKIGQSALAEYGRKQSQLIDSLVMGQDELKRDFRYQRDKLKRDKDYNIDGLKRDRDYKVDNVKRDRDLKKDKYKLNTSKLEIALADTKESIRLQTEKINKDLGFSKQKFDYSKDKINQTVDSAKKAKRAADSKIALDKYAANLAAHSKIPQKPQKPVQLPVPLEIPEALYPAITKPKVGPKPVEGTYTVPNTWDYINQGANVGLQILGAFA